MHDHDRDAILARRALLISAALAGLGCTTHEPASEREAVVEVQVPEVQVPEVPPGPSRPAWAELMAAVPPLDIPDGLTSDEQDQLKRLADDMRDRYAKLEEIWTQLPVCKPSMGGCEGWAHAVATIVEVRDDGGPLCGYSPHVTNTLIERRRTHIAYLSELGQLLLADLDAAAQALPDPRDQAAWQQEREGLAHGLPRPCLSCGRPIAFPVLDAVRFDAGQAELAAAQDQALARIVDDHQRNNKPSTDIDADINTNIQTKLIVRGHADASEPDAAALALARAEAVAKALQGLGLTKDEVEVRSFGATLPISRKAPELNRRVDFQVVLR